MRQNGERRDPSLTLRMTAKGNGRRAWERPPYPPEADLRQKGKASASAARYRSNGNGDGGILR